MDVVGVGRGGWGGRDGPGGGAFPNTSCLFRMTRLRIRLRLELSDRLVDSGDSEGLEPDSSQREVVVVVVGGSILRPAL